MLWVYLTLLAALCWATGNVISKYAIARIDKITATFGVLAASTVSALAIFFLVPVSFSIFGLLAGLFFGIAYYAFFAGLDENEVSRVSGLLLTNPIFTAVLSTLFLGEVLAPLKYLGIILVVVGSLFLSVDGWILRRGTGIVILSSLLFAISDVLAKVAVGSVDSVSVFFSMRLAGACLAGVLLATQYQKIKFTSLRVAVLAIGTGVLSDFGNLLYVIAISLAFVSIVTAVATTQALFVFVLAVAVTKLDHRLISEDLSRNNMLVKLTAILLLVAGVVIVVS